MSMCSGKHPRMLSTLPAAPYVKGGFVAEASAGALKFDDATVFANAAVTQRTADLVGCTVVVNYSITG